MKRDSTIIPSGFLTSAKRLYAHRQEIPGSRAPLVARILVQGLVTSGLDRLQRMIHPMGDDELPAPVFVIGHWRAGTTLLHELLVRDPRHTYPNTYDCFGPNHFLLRLGGLNRLMVVPRRQSKRK